MSLFKWIYMITKSLFLYFFLCVAFKLHLKYPCTFCVTRMKALISFFFFKCTTQWWIETDEMSQIEKTIMWAVCECVSLPFWTITSHFRWLFQGSLTTEWCHFLPLLERTAQSHSSTLPHLLFLSSPLIRHATIIHNVFFFFFAYFHNEGVNYAHETPQRSCLEYRRRTQL